MRQFEELILRLIIGPGIANATQGKLRILNTIIFRAAFAECTPVGANNGRVSKVGVNTIKATGVGYGHVDLVAPGHGFADQDLLFLGGVHVSLGTNDELGSTHSAVSVKKISDMDEKRKLL